jgi:hypothetical protein
VAHVKLGAYRSRGANRRRRYDNLNQAGDKPLARQSRNRPEQSNVDGDSRARIGDRFCLEFTFLYLKKVRQHARVACKASDAAIGVMKYDEVKLTAASRNLSGNLADSPE